MEYTATPSRPTPQYYTEEMSSHGPPSTPDSYTEEMSSRGPPSTPESYDSSFIENSNQLTILKTFYESVGSENSKSHL